MQLGLQLVKMSVFAVLPLAFGFQAGGAEYRISGPVTHENLSVFLIHGADQSGRKFLTLSEALAHRQVIVYETGQVNELAIENLSRDQDVYIQSGEIVKGGQQDRTFKDDLILGANSGRVPVAAFCVEHGRWTRRGEEAVREFPASPQAVATKQIKMAVRAADQSQVWSAVSRAQDRLSVLGGAGVRAAASPTSLMLSLESHPVEQQVDGYLHALLPLGERPSDIIGYAFAIDGKLNSAEVYASNELFRKLWPKLVRSSAVEAVANRNSGVTSAPPTLAAVKAALADADHGQASDRQINARTVLVTRETTGNVVFETRDKAQPVPGWIHRSYLTK